MIAVALIFEIKLVNRRRCTSYFSIPSKYLVKVDVFIWTVKSLYQTHTFFLRINAVLNEPCIYELLSIKFL